MQTYIQTGVILVVRYSKVTGIRLRREKREGKANLTYHCRFSSASINPYYLGFDLFDLVLSLKRGVLSSRTNDVARTFEFACNF